MGLGGEDGEPQVEGSNEDNSAEQSLFRDSLLEYNVLDEKQRKREQSQQEPRIEVESKVANVKGPRLDTIDVRAPAATAEDVVEDNVERYNCEFAIEYGINPYLEDLG